MAQFSHDDFPLYQNHMLEAAVIKQGQKPVYRLSRGILEMMFSQREQSRDCPLIRRSEINHAYPPSMKSISSLSPMSISDLRAESHHIRQVLFVRTFGHPQQASSISNAVEDTNGGVDRLCVYHTVRSLSAEQVLPNDTVFAVKSPYYNTTADGGHVIRVDHLSDLIRLDRTHPLFPREFISSTDKRETIAVDFKAMGNAAYLTKDYLTALRMYTQGIACCKSDSAVLFDMLRNRSVVNMHLGCFEAAEVDAKASFIKSQDQQYPRTIELNSKALYRAGRAAYELKRYPEASKMFQRALELTPTDGDILRQHKSCLSRLREASSGSYNFQEMSESASKEHNQLDHADFISNTVVRDAGKRGRGLFATCNIKAGELIFCEKAFSIARPSDPDLEMLHNRQTQHTHGHRHTTLIMEVTHKLRSNPQQAIRFLELSNAGHQPKNPPRQVDHTTVVDMFQVQGIIECNCFSCPEIRTAWHPDFSDWGSSKVQHSAGVWINASYMNHSCLANACRSSIGDMMIVRAVCDIAKDEEISISYESINGDHRSAVQLFNDNWGFQCDCALCNAQSKTPASQHQKREEITRQVSSFMSSNSSSEELPKQSTIDRLLKFFKEMETTYNHRLFKDLPRTGLSQVGLNLCMAYLDRSDSLRTLRVARNIIRDSGYIAKVELQFKRLSVDCSNAVPHFNTVFAAIKAAHAYLARGELLLAIQHEKFAKEVYQTLTGEMHSFDAKFGASIREVLASRVPDEDALGLLDYLHMACDA